MKNRNKKIGIAVIAALILTLCGAGIAPVLANNGIIWGGENNVSEVSDILDKLAKKIDEKKSTISSLNGNLDGLKKDLETAQNSVKTNQDAISSYVGQINALKSELENKKMS